MACNVSHWMPMVVAYCGSLDSSKAIAGLAKALSCFLVYWFCFSFMHQPSRLDAATLYKSHPH
jgi:hypothetical protein